MKRCLFVAAVAGLLAGGLLVLLAPGLRGQESGTKSRPAAQADPGSGKGPPGVSKQPAHGPDMLDTLPPWDVFDELADPAFDRYVDLELLGAAWADLDTAALTDVGLQLAEGERILMRPHKAISAGKVLQMAARLAGEAKDTATLDRLARAAERLADKDLETLVKTAQLLAKKTRAILSVMIPLDQLTGDAVRLFQGYAEDIRTAKLAGDRSTLESIEKELKELPELGPKQVAFLKKLTAEAKAALPEKQDPQTELLNLLAAESRRGGGGGGRGAGGGGGHAGGGGRVSGGGRPSSGGGRPGGATGGRPGGRPPAPSANRPRPSPRPPQAGGGRSASRHVPARVRGASLPRHHRFTRSGYSSRYRCRMWLSGSRWYFWHRWCGCYIPVMYINECPPDPDETEPPDDITPDEP
jgi:hypothetical protein